MLGVLLLLLVTLVWLLLMALANYVPHTLFEVCWPMLGRARVGEAVFFRTYSFASSRP